MHQRAETFVGEAADRYGFDVTVTEFPEGTKTAADAADAVGCSVGQIASSLVFDCGGELVVVVTSGANRVSEAKLATHLGVEAGDVSMADPGRIRDVVGWSIGGVPPFCHETDLRVLFDASLADYDTVWAAAGTPTSMFPIDPAKLRRLSDATSADVVE
ncbi:Cys-tRNA(Pro) deacylase, prolyl-tRNA editing enzyme YbaK/EbsC [Halopelagius inordinatus]|uniref:Cys-tRNA(Pro) deacylase, prolyl-tRNA editing enzyme YbaK/EbsC n=1 Tax=Halopelagius inordinatus TaxID=553467 RepID=A0A1I2NLT0_9EURY|nr:YbaK/EbsC family protein [Halopelagius inordinatus]SFG03729.1 Cys-tRNA(Pro) deacylase, prolyl-tRNA editing enzyme YbaK/EbsC [Halopelagius inordinatus]